jgi:hypothetical protein
MTSASPSGNSRPGGGFRIWLAVLLAIPAFWLLVGLGVASFFFLGSDAAALRRSLMSATNGSWHQKIALNVGGFTLGLARNGSHLFRLPPEPRAAIEAVRGAEVGIYELKDALSPINPFKVFSATDKVMNARGWERVVGVSSHRDLVAIYLPRKKLSPSNVKCCLAVLNDHQLVIVAARGNLQPLLRLAQDKLGDKLGDLDKCLESFQL